MHRMSLEGNLEKWSSTGLVGGEMRRGGGIGLWAVVSMELLELLFISLTICMHNSVKECGFFVFLFRFSFLFFFLK